jgi:membrane peptidoglycan carboxypeptidase
LSLAGADRGPDSGRAGVMTGRGPGGENGRWRDATIPLPVGELPIAGPGTAGPVADPVTAGPGYDPATGYALPPRRRSPRGPSMTRPRRRRVRRLLLWTIGVIASLVLLMIMAFGGLLLATPSVGNAPALARAQDAVHHVAYPGPAVPARFATSLVATEDKRFYSEPGIDLFAVARVGFAWATGHGIQGGATLYQQLAKLLYTHGSSASAADEAEQVALAFKLYLTYSNAQILQMYADVAYFGNGFYGLAAASCGYYGVEPAAMSWPQAALMAGLVQGPSMDDPLTHPANARAREVHVVGRLVATGKLTPAQGRAALAVPLSRLVARAGRGCSK